jgi:GT2 family glycosyltransferase
MQQYIVTAILTCYNRKAKTLKCLESLIQSNASVRLRLIIVDDGGTDGTAEAITEAGYHAVILHGDGNLFWAGGMRLGIDCFLSSDGGSDYVMFVNDDVVFDAGAVDALVVRSIANDAAVVVGATRDDHGFFSYGGLRFTASGEPGWYAPVYPSRDRDDCDMMNCNCVLIPTATIAKAGNFDPVYRHSLADLDYGIHLKKLGYCIVSSADYVGICNQNSDAGTWRDTSLPRIQRIRLKESVKNSPFREWFYFMRKNFGLWKALRYSMSPYLRILIGK